MRKRLPERIPQVQLATSHNTVKGPAYVYVNDEFQFQQLAFCEVLGGPFTVEFRAASLIYGKAFPTYEALRDAVNAHIAELEEIDDAEGLESHVGEVASCCEKGPPGGVCDDCARISDAYQRDMRRVDPVLDAIVSGGGDVSGHAGRAPREPHVSHAWRWNDDGAMQCPCGAVFEDFGAQGLATVGDPFAPCRGKPA